MMFFSYSLLLFLYFPLFPTHLAGKTKTPVFSLSKTYGEKTDVFILLPGGRGIVSFILFRSYNITFLNFPSSTVFLTVVF